MYIDNCCISTQFIVHLREALVVFLLALDETIVVEGYALEESSMHLRWHLLSFMRLQLRKQDSDLLLLLYCVATEKYN